MAELGPIALAEVTRRLADQQATLTATRTAAGTILTASTIGSAFLAGVALDDPARAAAGLTVELSGYAWAALIATALTAILAMLTLAPVTIGVATDPKTLAMPEWTAHNENGAALELAKHINTRAEENENRLDQRWWLVMGAAATTTASIVLWIAAIATR